MDETGGGSVSSWSSDPTVAGRSAPGRPASAGPGPIAVEVVAGPPEAVRGLSAGEAARRLEQVGPNEVQAAPRLRWLRVVLGFASNPLVVILLVASLVSG